MSDPARIGILLLALLLLPSGAGCLRGGMVAKVADFALTRSDVERKEAILRIYFPEYREDLRSAALKQLVDAYVTAEVLKNNGRAVTEKTLREEAARIDGETLMPEMLQRVKAAAGDPEGYLRVYVLPEYVGRIIYYEHFLGDKKIHAGSLRRAQDFLLAARAAGSRGFAQLSPGKDISLARLVVSREGILPADLKNDPAAADKPPPPELAPAAAKVAQRQKQERSAEAARWIEEILTRLKPGDVFSQVIDQRDTWWVVRSLGPKPGSKGAYLIEAAVFPKADFNAWFEAEKKKVPVQYP